MWFNSVTARRQQCLTSGYLSSIYMSTTLFKIHYTLFICRLRYTKIFASNFNTGVLANTINSGLENLSDRFTVNKLQPHPLKKTNLMVIELTYNLNNKSGDFSNVISILVSHVCSSTLLRWLIYLIDLVDDILLQCPVTNVWEPY